MNVIALVLAATALIVSLKTYYYLDEYIDSEKKSEKPAKSPKPVSRIRKGPRNHD